MVFGLEGTNPQVSSVSTPGTETARARQQGWSARCLAGSRHISPAGTVLPDLAETAVQ